MRLGHARLPFPRIGHDAIDRPAIVGFVSVQIRPRSIPVDGRRDIG
jgi:hypothetical protein